MQHNTTCMSGSISVVHEFSEMISMMHLGLGVWARTNACFYMFKTEKSKANVENRSLILLYVQFPCLWNGDGANTHHSADGEENCRNFPCLPYSAVGGRTFTVITGQCLYLKSRSFRRSTSGTWTTAWAVSTAIIRANGTFQNKQDAHIHIREKTFLINAQEEVKLATLIQITKSSSSNAGWQLATAAKDYQQNSTLHHSI